MVDHAFNDNDGAPIHDFARDTDAHGKAAMLLVESLIHGLLAKSVIGVDDAIGIVTTASDVTEEAAAEAEAARASWEQAFTILDAIRASLSIDAAAE